MSTAKWPIRCSSAVKIYLVESGIRPGYVGSVLDMWDPSWRCGIRPRDVGSVLERPGSQVGG